MDLTPPLRAGIPGPEVARRAGGAVLRAAHQRPPSPLARTAPRWGAVKAVSAESTKLSVELAAELYRCYIKAAAEPPPVQAAPAPP